MDEADLLHADHGEARGVVAREEVGNGNQSILLFEDNTELVLQEDEVRKKVGRRKRLDVIEVEVEGNGRALAPGHCRLSLVPVDERLLARAVEANRTLEITSTDTGLGELEERVARRRRRRKGEEQKISGERGGRKWGKEKEGERTRMRAGSQQANPICISPADSSSTSKYQRPSLTLGEAKTVRNCSVSLRTEKVSWLIFRSHLGLARKQGLDGGEREGAEEGGRKGAASRLR